MEFKELIEKRRSIRKFSERAVPREVVDRILHETLSAPSARNTRTTHLVVVDDPAQGKYPMPLMVAGSDPVYVGRIRRDLADPRGIALWVVADQIKKGAALNAVQIAQYLLSVGNL